MDNYEKLIEQRRALLTELHTLEDLVAGSFFARDVRGVRRYCLSRMVGKKQRQVYVSEADRDAVREGVERYRRALEVLRELGEINLTLIQNGVDLSHESES
jgi:hypothetical protein